MPKPSCLPSIEPPDGEIFHTPRTPVSFLNTDPDSPTVSWTGIDPEAALMAIVSCRNVQEATGLDRQGLLQRFTAKWTPDSALRECEFTRRS
jgi:protein EFR3